jgi:uncharacterized membrane protein
VPTNRIEAFTDGVVAIIITIMVLELKVPHDPTPAALLGLLPVLLSYVLSFVAVAIFWVNHHHLLHVTGQVTGRILWLNNHLLFWLSLLPFVTGFLGENHAAPLSVALYGVVMGCCGIAFDLLRRAIAVQHRDDEYLTSIHRRSNRKNAISAFMYLGASPLAYLSVWIPLSIFVLIPALYFMPGPGIERRPG